MTPAEHIDNEATWRDLALQFDGHRIEALALLRYVAASSNAHEATSRISEIGPFLTKPPLSGEAVLAQRLGALTELQHRRAEEAGTPDGWVLAPREPTEAMIAAGAGAVAADHGADLDPSAEADTALAYRAMLAASPSSSPSPASGVRVTVKPLEWHGPDFEDEYWAESLSTRYVIHPANERGVRWLGGVGGYFRAVDEAKAAAEAHNEALIRSALGEHP